MKLKKVTKSDVYPTSNKRDWRDQKKGLRKGHHGTRSHSS